MLLDDTINSKLDEFINSDDKNCLITGTTTEKHMGVLNYLNELNKKLRILVRINSMSECESLFGEKFKTGTAYRKGNITLYFDSMQTKSQNNTPNEFSAILIYPANSLKGICDENIIDIVNRKITSKIFWISNHDNIDFSFLRELCDINYSIEINNSDELVHNRILNNSIMLKNDEFKRIEMDDLYYSTIERAISDVYNLGSVYTSSLGHDMRVGEFDSYILGGEKKTGEFVIKAKQDHVSGRPYILVKSKK